MVKIRSRLFRVDRVYTKFVNKLNDKQYIKWAEKYRNPHEFISQTDKIFKFMKGDMFLEMGVRLSDFSYIDLAIHSYGHALKFYLVDHNRDGESRCYLNLGAAYLTLGDYTKAIEYLEKGLEINKEIGDREGQSDCYTNLSGAHQRLGDYTKAIEFQENALNLSREIGYKKAEAASYTNLGAIYDTLRHDNQAIEFQEKALEINKEIGDREGESLCYVNLGRTYGQLGNYTKAIEYLEDGLEIAKQIGDRHLESTCYAVLGYIYEGLGDFTKVIEFDERAFKIAEEIGDKYGESKAYSSIGIAYLRSGFYEQDFTEDTIYHFQEKVPKGIEYLEKGLEIAKQIGAKQVESENYGNIGMVYGFLGFANKSSADSAKAIEYLEKGLEIAKQIGEKRQESVYYRNLGLVYHELGDCIKAIEYLEMAAKIAKEIENRLLERLIDSTFGLIYYQNNRPEIAYDYIKHAIELTEAISGKVVEEHDKMAFFSMYLDAFDLVVPICLALGNEEKAFEFVERGKSRTFLDMLATSEIKRSFVNMTNDLKKLFIDEEKSLVRLRQLQSRDLRDTKTIVEPRQADVILKKLNEIYDKLKVSNPEYVSIRRASPLSLNKIQRFLSQKEDAVLVEYFIGENRIFIFVISSDKIHIEQVELSNVKLAQYTRNFETEVVDYYNRGYVGSTWLELSRYLIDPVSDYIAKHGMIYFVPYGLLHYIPLHALELKNEPLIKNHAVAYSPSASLLQFYKNKGTGSLQSCATFGVVFVEEAKEVAKIFNGKVFTEVSKEQVLKNLNNDILHFSCHGYFNNADPLSSGIELENGILTAKEILNLRLSSDLVTLSACQTGINEKKPGDELIGLTRALIYAGTPSVIVSLWSVYDPSTRELMLEFYKLLKDGKDKAIALQEAQIKIMDSKDHLEWKHPYYWAPFVLVGDWE